jgi:predicted nuclease of restriction endonuclease-like (RecB) superfamily
MIITYYQIGTIINQRKNWGNKYIEMLASDLKEYGKGYSTDQLKRMARFASYFSENEISAQAVHRIPWSTIIELMRLSSSKEEALWYANQINRNKWSRSYVLKQFELQAYQRQAVSPMITDERYYVQGIVKDTLAFDFISKNEVTDEKSLKDKLIDNILLFLQELGTGFALVGREYKLVTSTGKNYFIDLLMYHTKIHAYIVIEVKLEDITPADFG